jgi:hypothetical protein
LGVIALVLVLGLSALSVPAADRDTSPAAADVPQQEAASSGEGTRAGIHTAYYNQTFNIGSGWDWSKLTAVVWVQTGNYKQQSNPSYRSAEVLNAHAEEFDVGVTSTGQSRTVMAELATGTWCGACPGADGAFHRLREDAAWYPDKVVLIEWHYNDVYANADHASRIGGSGYATGGFPTAYFDGVDAAVGGASSPNTTRIDTNYRNKINARSPKATPIQIDTFGTISASGGWVNATVTAHSEPTIGNLFCYIAIVETGLSHNDVPLSNTGRNIILKQGFTIPNDFPLITLGDDFAGQTLRRLHPAHRHHVLLGRRRVLEHRHHRTDQRRVLHVGHLPAGGHRQGPPQGIGEGQQEPDIGGHRSGDVLFGQSQLSNSGPSDTRGG